MTKPFAIFEGGKVKLRYWSTSIHYAADDAEIEAWRKHLSNTHRGDPMRAEKAAALESLNAAVREKEEWEKHENV